MSETIKRITLNSEPYIYCQGLEEQFFSRATNDPIIRCRDLRFIVENSRQCLKFKISK